MDDETREDGELLKKGVSQRLLDVLFEWATWRNILILWGGFIAFNLLIIGPAYRRIEALSGGVGTLDFLIVYRPEKAYDMIAAYGEQGRRYYATIALTLDTICSFLSAPTFGLSLVCVFRSAFSRKGVLHRALFVPAAATVADLLENASILTMLLSYPNRLHAVALLSSSFSTVKWTAVAAEFALVIIGLIAWLVNVLREDTPDHLDQ